MNQSLKSVFDFTLKEQGMQAAIDQVNAYVNAAGHLADMEFLKYAEAKINELKALTSNRETPHTF